MSFLYIFKQLTEILVESSKFPKKFCVPSLRLLTFVVFDKF